METTIPNQTIEAARGWVFYDGECSLCLATVARFGPLLRRHRFDLAPLQTPWVQNRLGLKPAAPLVELKLLAADEEIYGGADALLQIAKHIWWAWPLFALAQIPGVKVFLHTIYRRLAVNRTCIGNVCRLPASHLKNIDARSPLRPAVDVRQRGQNRFADYTLLIALPAVALLGRNLFPAWIFMWLLAFAVYFGCKWLTWRRALRQTYGVNNLRSLGYLLGWIGMDAKQFLPSNQTVLAPPAREWRLAIIKIIVGAMLLWLVARHCLATQPLFAGWIGMVGIILCLHFGMFQLLSLVWRHNGVNATPIMQEPLRACSLADFWGRRWNGAFHFLAHDFIFRRVTRRCGVLVATLIVFLVSGVLHDLIISLPAHGGYGLPTAYFLIQGFGVLFERTAFAKNIGLGHGWRGWLFTVTLTAVPAFWLFHPLFIRNVILPMLHTIGAM